MTKLPSKEQILQMEAGPELDGLIDEHVMGHPKYEPNPQAEGQVANNWEYGPDDEGPFYIGKSYSHRSAATWEVMEKMRKEGVRYELRSSGHGDGHVTVGLYVPAIGWWMPNVFAPCPALAVCRAVMLVVIERATTKETT